MAEWRFFRKFKPAELAARLRAYEDLDINFGPGTGRAETALSPGAPDATRPSAVPAHQRPFRWRRYYTQAVIGREPPGPPIADGAFTRAKAAIARYEFSDPSIVEAHFDRAAPLEGRTQLLEIKVLGLHYLCATRVTFVRDLEDAKHTEWGYRYDTLAGHIEAGSEWFLLSKDHATGAVSFRILASWVPGEFPNFWSRLGFYLLSERYQLAWHRLAYLRLRTVARGNAVPETAPGNRLEIALDPVPRGRALKRRGPELDQQELWILRAQSPAVPAVAKAGALGGARSTVAEQAGGGARVEHLDKSPHKSATSLESRTAT